MSNDKKNIYFLPEGIESIAELIESEEFKSFVKENTPTIAAGEALSSMYKSKEMEGKMDIVYGQPKAQSLFIKYLKSINKPEKKVKYNFLLAYEGFSQNKNKL